MKIDFFNNNCSENSITESIFGICDDENGNKAYTNTTDESKWIARVLNPNNREILFTAVDNCIVIKKEGTNDDESTCDGMLRFLDNINLVELKNKRANWILEAKKQLLNTIKLLGLNHNLDEFKQKKAFASNKKHPQFVVISSENKKRFYNETNGFILDINSEITIK
ncbi:MAG: hypothetical protein DRJ09_01200 [Bacteroidetes bacterium]|nr:MAG: hypothetical protein DRJ09_01200 [Bacteroidota bacterium]